MVTVASSLLTGAPLPDCKTTEASLPSLSLLGGGVSLIHRVCLLPYWHLFQVLIKASRRESKKAPFYVLRALYSLAGAAPPGYRGAL